MYIIYGKKGCPNCEQAKELLFNMSVDFTYFNVENHENLLNMLEKIPNATKVPQIFLDNDLIGGYKELNKHFNDEVHDDFTWKE